MIGWLWVATAFGHGGPPFSTSLLWDASDKVTALGSHGVIFEDEGFNWVCDELFGSSLPTGAERLGDTLVVGTTQGVAWSDNGCDWMWPSELIGETIWDLAIDPEDGDRLWLATEEGLWRSDDQGASFAFSATPDADASVRAFLPRNNAEFTVLGFLDGQATAWVGQEGAWLSTLLPVEGGILDVLGADQDGNVYGRFPLAGGTDELVRIGANGQVESVRQTEDRIRSFLAADDALLVSVVGEGTLRSTDQGETWALHEEQVFSCLVLHDEQVWACPADGGEWMWARADASYVDSPTEWSMGPGFADVIGPRCPDSLLRCNEVWPDVAAEFGISPADTGTEARVTDTKSSCGCSANAAVVLVPWSLLWMGRRRASPGEGVSRSNPCLPHTPQNHRVRRSRRR